METSLFGLPCLISMVHHRASARLNSFIKGAWDSASCHTIRIAISLIIFPAHFMKPFDSSERGDEGGREGGRDGGKQHYGAMDGR